MSYVTAKRKWKRHHDIRVVGRTHLKQSVISGSDVFNLISSQGLPLDICLMHFKKNNLIVDWVGFVDKALSSGWNYKTILKKIRYSLLDVYNKTYTDKVILRLKNYLLMKGK